MGQRVFVRLWEVIRENAGKLYPGMELSGATLFRLTRDAEVELAADEEIDLRERVKKTFAITIRRATARGRRPYWTLYVRVILD